MHEISYQNALKFICSFRDSLNIQILKRAYGVNSLVSSTRTQNPNGRSIFKFSFATDSSMEIICIWLVSTTTTKKSIQRNARNSRLQLCIVQIGRSLVKLNEQFDLKRLFIHQSQYLRKYFHEIPQISVNSRANFVTFQEFSSIFHEFLRI